MQEPNVRQSICYVIYYAEKGNFPMVPLLTQIVFKNPCSKIRGDSLGHGVGIGFLKSFFPDISSTIFQ